MTEEEYFEYLILSGAVAPAGIDPETNEMLYSFTDKLASIAPSIAHAADEEFYSDIMELWQAGLISMDVTAVNPVVRPTDLALDDLSIAGVSKNAQETLKMILQAMRK